MIAIKVDNKNLILNRNTELRLELNSPLFDSEIIQSSIVYPFNVPVTGNAEIFEFAHLTAISNTKNLYSTNCSFYFAGKELFAGKLILKQADAENYSIAIIVEPFAVDFSKHLISSLCNHELTLGETPEEITNYANTCLTKSYHETNYNFPQIYAPNFYGNDNEKNSSYLGFINEYDLINQNFYTNKKGEEYELWGNRTCLMPLPYLFFAINNLFTEHKYKVIGSFFEHQELAELLILNNYPLDKKTKKDYTQVSMDETQEYIFTSLLGKYQLMLHSLDNEGNEDIDNCYNFDLFSYEIKSTGIHEFYLKFNAEIYPYAAGFWGGFVIWDGIGNGWETALYIESDFYFYQTSPDDNYFEHKISFSADNSHVGKFICYKIQKNVADPYETYQVQFLNATLSIANISLSGINLYTGTINLKNHLPKLTASEFINTIKDVFGLGVFFDFNSKTVEFCFKTDILNSTKYIDLTNFISKKTTTDTGFIIEFEDEKTFRLAYKFSDNNEWQSLSEYSDISTQTSSTTMPIIKNTNQVVKIINSGIVYISAANEESGLFEWQKFSHNFAPFGSEEASNKIEPAFAPVTLAEIAYELNAGLHYICPETFLEGNSSSFNIEGSEVSTLNLMFYKGKQLTNNSFLYPYATSLKYASDGDVIGNLTLLPTDIYNEFHKQWNDFLKNAKNVTVKLQLNTIVLMDIIQLFSTQNSYNNIRKIQLEHQNYIPKQISIILTTTGIKECEAKLLKL